VLVEVWSDVVCPWCYIGKRRFERAVEQLAGEIDVEVVYRPFQLDPTAPPGTTTSVPDAYARKFGGPERAAALIDRVTTIAAGEGLEFHLDRARRANTLLAHRLIAYAMDAGGPELHERVKERLLRAYFVDGLDVGDVDTLADCATDVGMDRDAVHDHLRSEAGRDDVAAELTRATELGITAVPTYVMDGRWSIPGAQDTHVFVQVLRRLHARAG
jgi:predicted DsbA family dithiol-disulfide isomerase